MQTLEQLRTGALAGTRHLRLSQGLTEFPREIFELADTLEVLDLSGNALEALPDDLYRLDKLRILFASNNAFTELPAGLGRCPSLTMIGFKANRIHTVPAEALPIGLRWLILTDNALDTLPDEIGKCARLQKLMLAGNRLESLPQTLAACRSLELLRISANRLTALPDWLLAMPRLSWLAFAGNPFCAEPQAAAHPDIDWQALTLETKLGEGASGVIYRAHHRDGKTLAVKIFKGAVTSDGLPSSEMQACLAAGQHPNLIPVLGRVTGHPEGRDVLALDLIDADFAPLAGPPDFETCTRDVYATGARFDLETVRRIALGIASAAGHLHARGLMHGDLYAHNILTAQNREPVIGDFGAASFYEADPGHALQRLEVCAFGCLLEELVARCPDADADMSRLAASCLSETPHKRPLFEDIVNRLHP